MGDVVKPAPAMPNDLAMIRVAGAGLTTAPPINHHTGCHASIRYAVGRARLALDSNRVGTADCRYRSTRGTRRQGAF
jgi:hypothetical protein